MEAFFTALLIVLGSLVMAHAQGVREVEILAEKAGAVDHSKEEGRWMPEKVEVVQGETVLFVFRHELEGRFDFHGLEIIPLQIKLRVYRHKPASLFTPGAPMRAWPLLGDLGAGNIALLLNEPSVDIAFVSADALTAASAAHGAALAEKLELVARLYPQEVHVLARAEIKTVAQLAGKRVSIGPEGSGSAART